MQATLNRLMTKGRAVIGRMTLPFPDGEVAIDTLENADFIIPAGKYQIKITWSPKFKKPLPQIMDVPDRDGIRIHMGTKPEHSTGCVLVDFRGLQYVKAFINSNNYYEDEETCFISINDSVPL